MIMDPWIILLITVLNFFVAFFAVSVGGSGLVMTPLMLAFGIPAPNAIAVKRFSNIGMSGSAILKFHLSGKIKWKVGLHLIVVSVLAAYIAANIVLSIDETILKRIIALVIIVSVIYIFANKKFGLAEKTRKSGVKNKISGAISYFVAIFTAHISGGGGGIFTSHVLIHFYGQTFLQSAGTRKISGTVGTITAVIVYIAAGAIIYELAVPMLISGIFGAWIGAHYAIKKGDAWVRKLFMVVAAILAMSLLFF